jgi:hypothetical protein
LAEQSRITGGGYETRLPVDTCIGGIDALDRAPSSESIDFVQITRLSEVGMNAWRVGKTTGDRLPILLDNAIHRRSRLLNSRLESANDAFVRRAEMNGTLMVGAAAVGAQGGSSEVSNVNF